MDIQRAPTPHTHALALPLLLLHAVLVLYIMVRLDTAVQRSSTLQEVVWGAAGHVRLPSARCRVKLQAGGRHKSV